MEAQTIGPKRGYLWVGMIVLLFAAMLYFYYFYPGRRNRPAAADLLQPPRPCRGERDRLPVLSSLRGTVAQCRVAADAKMFFLP